MSRQQQVKNSLVDEILKTAIPPSYNTRSKRYKRAIEALLALRDEAGGKIYNRKSAAARLDVAAGAVGAPLIATIRIGLKLARTTSGRNAAQASHRLTKRDPKTKKYQKKY